MKNGKSIWPLSSPGPSQVLEMNRNLCILLPKPYVSIECCVFSVHVYTVGLLCCIQGYLRDISIVFKGQFW